MAQERFDAAASAAAHAGINSADVITGIESKQRSSGSDHSMALTLLRRHSIGKSMTEHLKRLLYIKPVAEYDHTPVTQKDAEAALRAADKLLAAARKIVQPKT